MKKRASNSVLIYLLSGGIVASFIFVGSSFVFNNFNSFRYSAVVEEEIANQEIEKPVHLPTPDSVRGIYMTSWVASTRDWRASLVKLVEETELNSIVIDVKDYTGKIAFEVSDPELQKIGSAEKRIDDVKDFVKSLHEKNIYAIARIAVFQDPYLAKVRPDLAVKTKTGTVWKDKKGMTWVDPCSKEVWDYTVRIAKETERMGFDELNFDYIRFASDGDMGNIVYHHCVQGVSKADALESFFKYLSENLKELEVPISADLFGMVTTNTDDLNIGQVLEKAEPYFSYICPMVYPSHYPPTYNGFKNPALYPYEVIKLAMDTASQRLIIATSTPDKLRPWLQDFDLGATYTAEMVRKEKQAVYDAGLRSWLLWDPSNQYTREALD
ncbi:putative glycoside hydrolase [Patescibacteria group bacterium]|nr:putative glycoside hydrolase [Patescibacteria group bacterium]MBU2263636.1 putative glycoside hydrolase [Patescibacteria group bacterium]